MCLAVPLKIIEIKDKMATGELETIKREVSIALTPNAKVGDWVLVHAGYAIQIIEESEADETIKLLKELSDVAYN
ncbi:hydrogenase expression/formation protein HypC [Desulfitispora alkaliphila]|uniref:HypC/HybG/HupF family hydrogenase formation chaperone n=1 Tax=Desulfitispora alkaliphila TaxID=622674 RepID=UPI003D1E5BE2